MWLKLGPYFAVAMLTAFIVGFVANALHQSAMADLRDKHREEMKAALDAQAIQMRADCEADKKLTSEVSNDYQTEIAKLNTQLRNAKRVRPSACIPVTMPASRTAAGRDAGTGTGQPSGSDAVDSDTLLEFAAEAEQYRIQLTSCQRFIHEVWQAKGAPQ